MGLRRVWAGGMGEGECPLWGCDEWVLFIVVYCSPFVLVGVFSMKDNYSLDLNVPRPHYLFHLYPPIILPHDIGYVLL